MHWQNEAKRARKFADTIVDIERNACTAATSAIHQSSDGYAIDIAALHQSWQKRDDTDSESRVLAIKKFSC
jgi:hypothetical protein